MHFSSRLTRLLNQSKAGRQARSLDMPTLTANIFVATTNRTNIDTKTGGRRHLSVWFSEIDVYGLNTEPCIK